MESYFYYNFLSVLFWLHIIIVFSVQRCFLCFCSSYTKKEPRRALILASRMLSIVCLAFHHPIPRFQRLLASGEVLLGDEGLLIVRDLAQVLTTIADSRCNRCKAYACIQFTGARCRAALYFLTHVDAIAVWVLRCCYAVRTKQHLRAAVLAVLTRFTQCAGYTIDTGAPFYFCHSCVTILDTCTKIPFW